MLGSEFVATYGRKGLPAWEAAALELAKQGQLTPWPWVDLALVDGPDTVTFKVASDVLSVGTAEDYVRLPLTPGRAQDILNLSGSLMTTPWLEYQIWRAAPVKLTPTPMLVNADLAKFAEHSRTIDGQLAARDVSQGTLVSGHKKAVVVSNIFQKGKVLIYGWFEPPPAPDVFDNGLPMNTAGRQPRQPKSNVHGDFYADYSHGIRAVHPVVIVNGVPMATIDLYQHPTLSRFVSNEDKDGRTVRAGSGLAPAPIRVPRYPSVVVPPPAAGPVAVAAPGMSARVSASALDDHDAPDTHGMTEIALDAIAQQVRGGR